MLFTARQAVYRFGAFVLDSGSEELRTAQGARVTLRPKSFALLRLLIENAGRLVTREAILAALWPGIWVTDDSITQCVRDIRLAIDDDEQRMLKTAQRRGYVFAAEVRYETEPTSSHGDCVIVSPYRPSIAVLPFTNLSGDTHAEHVWDDFDESIAAEISRGRGLSVVRATGLRHGNLLSNVRRIADQLAVHYVLEGSLRCDQKHVLVDVRLIGAGAKNLIWAQRYHRQRTDTLSVQNAIAVEVATTVQSVIVVAERTHLFGASGSWRESKTGPLRNLMMATVLALGRDNAKLRQVGASPSLNRSRGRQDPSDGGG